MTDKRANKPVAEFDPQKNYKWEPEDIVRLSGMEFASLYHCLNQEVNNAGGSPIALKFEAYSVVMDIFKKGVQDGWVVETDGEEVDESKVKQLFK